MCIKLFLLFLLFQSVCFAEFTKFSSCEFYLVEGRLCISHSEYNKGTVNKEDSGVREEITVVSERGIPSIHYLLSSESRTLKVSVTNTNTTHIDSVIGDERVTIDQSPLKSIVMTYYSGDETKIEGDTLLHIRENNKEIFDKHITPFINVMLDDLGDFGDFCDKVKSSVFSKDFPRYNNVDELVEELSLRKQSNRMAAYGKLLNMGTIIRPKLLEKLREDNPFETNILIRRLLEQVRTPSQMDNIRSLSTMLSQDSSYLELIR